MMRKANKGKASKPGGQKEGNVSTPAPASALPSSLTVTIPSIDVANSQTFPNFMLGSQPFLLICITPTLKTKEQIFDTIQKAHSLSHSTNSSLPTILLLAMDVNGFPKVASQLQITTLPTCFAVLHGQFLDSLKGSVGVPAATAFLNNFRQFAAMSNPGKLKNPLKQGGNPTDSDSDSEKSESQGQPASLKVDIRKMLEIGRRCLDIGQTEYAERIYKRALAVLQSIQKDPSWGKLSERNQVLFSSASALCLAGISNCCLLSHDTTESAAALYKCHLEFPLMITPETEVAKAFTMFNIIEYLGVGFPEIVGFDRPPVILKSTLQGETPAANSTTTTAPSLAPEATSALGSDQPSPGRGSLESTSTSTPMVTSSSELSTTTTIPTTTAATTTTSAVAPAHIVYNVEPGTQPAGTPQAVPVPGTAYTGPSTTAITEQVDRLRTFLRSAKPQDSLQKRAELVILLLWLGKIQEGLTECIKIFHINSEWQRGFGKRALDKVINMYLGPEHILSINAREIVERMKK